MNNFTNFNELSNQKEREYKDSQQVNIFLDKADTINEQSSTKDICNLIAEITDYEAYQASFFHDILSYLQKLLSNCIKSKCNCNTTGFIKLHDYINYEKNLLSKLQFT